MSLCLNRPFGRGGSQVAGVITTERRTNRKLDLARGNHVFLAHFAKIQSFCLWHARQHLR